MAPMEPIDIASFAVTQLKLLDAELKAETAETAELTQSASPKALQRSGLAILNLTVSSQRTGLGGKTVIELELDPAVVSGSNNDLPEHGLRAGDIVGVSEQAAGAAKKVEKTEKKEKGVSGVVVRTHRASINVALDKEDAEVPAGKLWIVKLANDVTYKRMNDTMKTLEKSSDSTQTSLMRVVFGHSKPTTPSPDTVREIIEQVSWTDPTLNDSQKEAIRFALAAPEVALIHGPPGTGKTHTLIELILQLLKQGRRLLVCGPSNVSVDNIVERLAPHKVPMVRVGHPARLLPAVVQHSLDVLTRTSDAAGLVRDIRDEMDAKQASIRKTRNGRERRLIYGELKDLRKEYRERERRCTDGIVGSSKVVLATLHGAGGWHVKHEKFDAIVIDEASQALEASCWVPIIATGCDKLVLAGDHLQLPPTIKSSNSKKTDVKETATKKDDDQGPGEQAGSTTSKHSGSTLETTLFDRLLELYGDKVKRMLTTQYRMHEQIMNFPSKELYDNELLAADAVKARLLKELPYDVKDTEDTREPLVFWDTQGGEFPEKTEEDNLNDNKKRKSLSMADSKSNELEAALTKMHVRNLVEAGIKPEDIAIVTPYNAQLALLSQLLKETYPGLELGSVDGFQGREKEAIIVTLVRSNAEHEVGFLADKRRLNVAMTRPKRHLCVVGDSETITSGSGFLKRWMGYLEENADLRYPNAGELYEEISCLPNE